MDDQTLREVFKRCTADWVFWANPYADPRDLLAEMADLDRYWVERFGVALDPPIAQRIEANPARLKALVEAFASPMTTPIRAMILQIIEGAIVLSIRLDYRRLERLRIEIEIETPDEARHAFSSEDVWDMHVFRHFGLIKVDQGGVIDGYYPFRDDPDWASASGQPSKEGARVGALVGRA